MSLSHIVAVSQNDVIGVNNDLPWEIPEDMKFFRDKTKGRAMIMGRKTYESVGHPLPHRLSIIVTRNKDYKVDSPLAVVKPDLRSAIEYAQTQVSKWGDEIFIIGGGEIFKESMDIVDVIYLTRIHKDFDGDIKYPKVDPKKFQLVEQRDRTEPVPFSFLTYARKSGG
jgi:dihydrofolate reductase